MTHWDEIRAQARVQRLAALAKSGDDCSAAALLAAADELTGFERRGLPADDPLLDGADAVLNPALNRIWFNHDVEPRMAAFYQAHEYAHLWLHREQAVCHEEDLDPEVAEEPMPLGVQRVEGYGPEERREREANVFAREFLAPTDALYGWYWDDGLDASAIGEKFGLPDGVVLQQLARALLTPDTAGISPPVDSVPERPLDQSQEEAAHLLSKRLLIEAGPGTGKTRTLVGRIVFLLRQQSVPPSSVLALTYSNRAAEEMRARVGRAEPKAALQIWMGTFHAFGLELLRKYGVHIGLPPRPVVLDPADAVTLLERALPDLGLDHYQNLYEPTTYLRDILAAISRAKDEMHGPADYTASAERMLDGATTEQEILAAGKALEVARVYTHYQAALDAAQLLDYGDLIYKAVELLHQHPDVQHLVHQTFRHVLVDEYQDVNRASGLLLREIVGNDAVLWVVGDARQAIYRFRGASPANLRLFSTDFPEAKVRTLERNYRSQPAIIDTFSGMAPTMRAARGGPPFTPWVADRSANNGQVIVEIADDIGAEGGGLAQEIERQRAAGVPYRDQVVLCRSHSYLGRIAAELERVGVPVLYLGDLFERPEVRDMLALIQLACEPGGSGLVRVARFPEYRVPLADVLTLLEAAREQEAPFPGALQLASAMDAISAPGKNALGLLAQHIDGLCHGSHPWTLLSQYLFVRSGYLRSLLADDSVSGQQRLLALYQFLQFVHEQQPAHLDDKPSDPKRHLLRYVRRLEMFGEEKQLRQVPSWADGIDAVRLLTVHAAKGLEFRVVYLPALGQGIFPARRRGHVCPVPAEMVSSAGDEREEHREEEECLFFVALSRARDVLCVSRARRYGSRNSNPSDLLTSIARFLPRPPDGPVTWPSTAAPVLPPPDPAPAIVPFGSNVLDVYIRCPRKFFYEFVLGLTGSREDSVYLKFHSCVYQVLSWMAEERAADRPVDVATARARLIEVWAQRGPHDHPYAGIYWQSAESMIVLAAERPFQSRGPATRPEWVVNLPHGQVTFTPDHVEAMDDGTEVVERLRTGRPTESELEKDIYALYQVAAQEALPRVPRAVQVRYLSTGEVSPVELKQKTIDTRLGKYDDAVAGILREEFAPIPDDRNCPRCPFYFICPVAEDV